MGKDGFEPSRVAPTDPKSDLSANSSTSPLPGRISLEEQVLRSRSEEPRCPARSSGILSVTIERQLPIDPDLGLCSLLDELDAVLNQEANQLIPCNKLEILPSPTESPRH